MTLVLGQLLRSAALANRSGGVVAADSRLHTWGDLDDAAERLASCLIDHGVVRGDRVGVLHPKSVESFVAVHAIVRCGAVMVPLDPFGPPHAVQSVLDFCEPTAIVGNAKTVAARAPDFVRDRVPYLVVSGDDADVAALGIGADRISTFDAAVATEVAAMPAVQPDDLAYIIFTSGSTGDPKGIAHTHRSALAYVENALAVHGLTASDRIAGTSPLHFDMSTLELYVTPMAGATAVTITEAELRFPASLSSRIEDAGVSVLYAVPYQLRQLCVRGDLSNRDFSAVRQVSFGGEQFAPGVLKELAEAVPAAQLLNVYGPAEVNGIVSHAWAPDPPAVLDVPIGAAWPGVGLVIVDEDLVAVDEGEAGELLVACASQMRGYWKRTELNDHCFVERDGQRWYRTGDIVKTDAEGLLHFLGRADTRVKVRGVRLELETIENALSDAPGVDSAVAGVSESGAVEQIVAWILPDGTVPLDVDELRRWCMDRLPSSAVPAEVRFVDSFPQSRTGKIDRKQVREALAASPPSS